MSLLMLRRMLHENKHKVKEAFAGESLQTIFQKADKDADGYLSYQEVNEVLGRLQEVCGKQVVDPTEVDRLTRHIDLSKTGRVTFLEFVAAFGLPEVVDMPQGEDPEEEQRLSEQFVRGLMQHILSALYERSHAMQKAFRHMDSEGSGWLPMKDFEEALRVVLTEDPRHHVLLGEQVKAFVQSLRGCKLTDEQERIDYPAFILAFEVVEVKLEDP